MKLIDFKRKTIVFPVLFILCLTTLWNINISKTHYCLTPWKSLGSPPAKAVRLLRVDLPGVYQSKKIQPIIYVYSEDRKIYSCCSSPSVSQWGPGEYSYYAFSDYERDRKIMCARQIKQKWQLGEEEFLDAKDFIAQGECTPYNSDKLAIYQIKQDGTVWRKYVNEENIKNFRERLSFYISLLMLLYILKPIRYFRSIDPLALRPDYDAQ